MRLKYRTIVRRYCHKCGKTHRYLAAHTLAGYKLHRRIDRCSRE